MRKNVENTENCGKMQKKMWQYVVHKLSSSEIEGGDPKLKTKPGGEGGKRYGEHEAFLGFLWVRYVQV
jgi:hypothetical protein